MSAAAAAQIWESLCWTFPTKSGTFQMNAQNDPFCDIIRCGPDKPAADPMDDPDTDF